MSYSMRSDLPLRYEKDRLDNEEKSKKFFIPNSQIINLYLNLYSDHGMHCVLLPQEKERSQSPYH